MTGFGQADQQAHGLHYAVELRSLNNRFFKASIRLPEVISGLEAELDTLLRHRVARGSLTLVVRTNETAGGAGATFNAAALRGWLEQLERVRAQAADPGAVHIDLSALLALPGVMAWDEADHVTQARPVVLGLTQRACDQLNAMRADEGRRLAAEFAEHLAVIRHHLARIVERSPVVVEEYHQRLRTRIDELIARAELNLSQPDLVREVAIFAEKCDVREETSRIMGHIEQFERLQAGDEPVGRTLEFIAQELLREANTIASKSADASIAQAVVIVKGAIDRIKEQAANVE